jgi:hypothetical protein
MELVEKIGGMNINIMPFWVKAEWHASHSGGG